MDRFSRKGGRRCSISSVKKMDSASRSIIRRGYPISTEQSSNPCRWSIPGNPHELLASSRQAVKPSYWRPGLTVRPDTSITKGDGSNNDNGKRSYSSESTILVHLIKPRNSFPLRPSHSVSLAYMNPIRSSRIVFAFCRALSFFFAQKKSVSNERELSHFQLQRLQ